MVWFLFLGALALAVYRITIGVDFSDESFHVATAYHFDLGAKAFVDESSVRQTFAFFTLPFLRVFGQFSRDNDYIILQMRFAFLFVYGFFCWAFYHVLIRKAKKERLIAGFSCLITFFFVPTSLFSLHYANLGYLFLGLCLLLKWLHHLFLSGIFLGCATLAHPAMFLPALFLIIFSRKNKLTYLSGFLSAWLFFMGIFDFSPADYLKSIIETREVIRKTGVELGVSRFYLVLSDMVPKGPILWLLICWFGFFISFVKKEKNQAQLVTLLIFPFLVFFNSRVSQGGIGNAGYLLSLAYLSPILLYANEGKRELQKYLMYWWGPCFLALMGFSLVSSGGVAGTIGCLLPLLPFSLVFLAETLNRLSSGFSTALNKGCTFGLLLVFGLFFIRYSFQNVYQEKRDETGPMVTVESGPFKGLKTTQTKKDFIVSLQSDLEALPRKEGRIVFSCFFPAGYLLTQLLPNHDFLWGVPLLSEIKANTDVVVRLYDDVYPKLNVWPQRCSPLPEIIAGNQGDIIRRQNYEIWVRRSS